MVPSSPHLVNLHHTFAGFLIPGPMVPQKEFVGQVGVAFLTSAPILFFPPNREALGISLRGAKAGDLHVADGAERVLEDRTRSLTVRVEWRGSAPFHGRVTWGRHITKEKLGRSLAKVVDRFIVVSPDVHSSFQRASDMASGECQHADEREIHPCLEGWRRRHRP